ncbi:hypothetical protein ACQEWB_47480 [Streptomyces sp. CA-249302]|uniref:hypothetical protein n=1 Tax=Streptomyces sp. CA-249302 TaxID=3240058 RepID=UPI003D912129
MRFSSTARPTPSPTLWLAHGHHPGSDAPDAVRRTLRRLRSSGVVDDHLELPAAEDTSPLAFETRWRVAGTVTVRARLTLTPGAEGGHAWTLAAEAERPWDQEWPSPATMFWPDEPDADWDHEPGTGLRLRRVNHLPTDDDKEIRQLLRNSVRDGWTINLVVHEAMTPDAHGRGPLGPLLPPSLRHRVLEHRAAPDQLRIVNRALREFGVQLPRGGAVLLPADRHAFDAADFAVRTVFLDGSRPTDLVDALSRLAALPPPLPDGAEEVVAALREEWRLMTLEEELARERGLVAMYAEALESMTKSRDLYREAAERAHEALEAYRESGTPAPAHPQPAAGTAGSPFQGLTRTFERLKETARGLRPAPDTDTADTADKDVKPKQDDSGEPSESPGA